MGCSVGIPASPDGTFSYADYMSDDYHRETGNGVFPGAC
jgi:hypothetical protein